MMLDDIPLSLKTDEYPRVYRSDFLFRTRYLSSFLRRHLRESRAIGEGFRQMSIEGTSIPKEECWISSKSLVAEVFFDQNTYDRLAANDLHEFLISMLLGGVEKCAIQHDVPATELAEWVDEFRALRYRNEWVHMRKAMRKPKLVALLLCSLDTEKFVLTLRLETPGGKTLFEEKILETKPDELLFKHKFKDVILDGGLIVVRNRQGSNVFQIAIDGFVTS
jgi:hypothetical protein